VAERDRAARAASRCEMVISLLAVLLVVFLGARWALRPKHADPPAAERQPQSKFLLRRRIRVRCFRMPPNSSRHRGHDGNGQALSSKEFYFRNSLTGKTFRADRPFACRLCVSGKWLLGFCPESSFGNCQLEYLTDLAKLKSEYGFKAPIIPWSEILAAVQSSIRSG